MIIAVGFKVNNDRAVRFRKWSEQIVKDYTIQYFDLMEESIYQIAEKISKLYQEAYDVYLPLVEDVCSREVSEDELSHFLDYLLDFACDEKILGLYKKVCRRYLYVYPGCIKSYIEAYREMWEDKDSSVEFLGLWERLHNSDFKPLEFEGVKNEAGLNRFVVTSTKWITQMNASASGE